MFIKSKLSIAGLLALILTVATAAQTPTYVKRSGDAMTGPLTLSSDPSVPLGAATKQYVDAHGSGSSVRTATIVLAASNSPQKASADTVCTGTNDQTCINTAIASCPGAVSGVAGCRVMLMNGVYNLSGSVVIDNDDITLVGEQHCMWGGYNHAWTGTSDPTGAIGTGCSQLLASTIGFNLIEVQHNNAGGVGGDTSRHRGIDIENLYMVGSAYSSDCIVDLGQIDDNVFIKDNICQRVNNGFDVNLDTGEISDNSIQDVANNGINYSGILGRVINNLIYDVGGNCISLSSPSIVVANNVLGDCTGVYVGASNHASLTGNSFTVNIGNDVYVTGSRGLTITGNTFNDYETRFGYSPKMPIRTDVIVADASSPGMVVSGNSIDTLYGMGGYAINFGASTGGVATGNTILGVWNYGGPAIGGTALTAVNSYPITIATGPATAPSVTIQARYLASSLLGQTSGSAITSWPDSSGLGRPLGIVSGAPIYVSSSTINGGPAVRFNGTSDSLGELDMLLPDTIPQRTVYAVVHLSSLASTLGRAISIVNSTATETTNALYVDPGTNKLASFAGTSAVSDAPALTTSSTYVVELVANGATSRMAVNGSVSSTMNIGTDVWGQGIHVGTSGAGGVEYFPGDIAEIDIYYGAANSGDAQAIGAALCATYGVTCGTSW